MGFKSVVPFRGELSTNGQNWITLGGGKTPSQEGATIRSPAGRWSLLTVAADAAAAAVVEFYANGVKRFELAIPSTAGIVTNTADFYDAADGDEIAIVFVRNNAFNRNVRPTGSIQFEASAGTGPVAFHHATRANTYASGGSGSGSISTLTFGQTYNSTSSTLLTRTPCSFQSAGVLSHFRMVRTQNAGNVAVVATVHINGSPTSITVSMAAGFTGTVEDTTHTATIGPDDVVTIVCVETTSGGTYTIDQACLRFTSTDGAYDLFNATIGQALSSSFVNNAWAAAGGGLSYNVATTGLVIPHAVEISDARVVVGPAGGTFVPTFGLNNGAWFDTFVVPDAAGITETKSTGQTRLGAGSRVALGIESTTGESTRGMGAMGLTLRESALQTSYDNPGGSEDRRDGRIWAHIEGTASNWNGNPIGLLGDTPRNENYSTNISGSVRIVFDFFAPRIVDELSLTLSTNAAMGQWAFEGSNDGANWTTLTAPSSMSGSRVFGAYGNVTAYRYYSLYKASGVSSTAPYWQRVRFRIDDDVSKGSWPVIAKGDRRSIITLTTSPLLNGGGSFSETIIGGRAVSGVPGPGYLNSGRTDGIITFDFSAPVVIQGAVFFQSPSYALQGVWKWQGSNDGTAWDDLSDPVSWNPTIRGIPTTGSSSPAMGWMSSCNPSGNAYSRYRLFQTGGETSNVPYLTSMVFIVGEGANPPAVVYPSSGKLIFTGAVPEIIAAISVSPDAGRLLVYGGPVDITTSTIVDAGAAALILTGRPAAISIGTTVSPGHGSLVITGGEPLIYTVSGAVSSQIAMLAVSEVVPNAVSSQIAALALAEPPPPPTRSSQIALMAVAEVVPDVCASQVAIMVLAHSTQCVTQDCQIWTITRRDGEVFRYTSLDRNVTYGGKVYKACGSMDPSAAQNGATLGDVGSISLSGIISDDGVSEADLFGGLFDDAFVTTDLIDWGNPSKPPKRLASGWVGKVTQGPAFHTMEVLSIGARLEQTALVQVVSPSCRWRFGDAKCGVNVEAMKLPATIRRVINRGDLVLDIATPPDDGRIWASGRIRFLDGPCAGMVCEYKGVDFATGQIILWTPAALAPIAGNAVEVLPGCDLTRDGGCKSYQNRINFGGFPDVPGTDAILETPDAKI